MPNDFAEDGSYPVSLELSGDQGGFDKALLKFYLNQVRFTLSWTFHFIFIFSFFYLWVMVLFLSLYFLKCFFLLGEGQQIVPVFC